MFEESLVESTSLLRTRQRGPVLTSITIQAVAVAAILSIPLMHPEAMQVLSPKLSVISMPLQPKPIPPPPPPVHVDTPMTAGPVMNVATTAAPHISSDLKKSFESDAKPVDGATLPMMSGTPRPDAVFTTGGSRTGIAITEAPPSAPPAPIGPINVSTGVSAGLLLEPIHATYPQIAMVARIQGTVVVEAIISKQGRIESAQAVSGPDMLKAAALDAVRNARYKPYRLNGQPTEVQTTFSVNFRLSGQ